MIFVDGCSFGIAGFGFVGQAVYGALKSKDRCVIYDPPKGYVDIERLKKTNIIFCCLPTPTSDGIQDLSAYRGFLKELGEYKGILVIKSTMLPGWAQEFSDVDNYNIVMNPEFLNQNSAYEDFKNQKTVLLGGKADLLEKVEQFYKLELDLNRGVRYIWLTLEEACYAKYVHNVYHAYKVLFWNYVQELTGNSRKMFDLYSKITGNTNEMARICTDGKPGFGGKCFPDNVAAIDDDYPHCLTDFMLKYNDHLRNKKSS